ncbi:amino acid permease family protein [Acidithiobacillus sp. GGI-221]|nr:amino acid permease family protein [Acidithiobacillus sp. GGI-221]
MGSLLPFFQLFDLGTLSVSSVAPIFSVAAAGSVMAQAAGAAVPLAIVLIAIPFILCSWIFLSLNQHFPNAGASYHWSRRIIGIDFSNFQAWIIILAYFWSIPPILIPAAQFTYRALGIPHPGNLLQILGAMFWAVFALIVLLFGARMTARVTQIFLVIEVLSVAFMAVIGYAHWGPAAVGAADFSFSHLNWGGVIVCMVVAATIVDGWEIDSYASEEAKKPRITPGWGGIIGAVSVVAYYLLIWPLLLHQLPLDRLSTTSDTLSLWAGTVAPGLLPYFRIAIICSTAGSLWLTTFILSRALYAMGRDGVMPNWVAGLNRFGVPHWPVVLPMGLSMIVVALQMFFPSTRDLFNLVLSAAGFFLVGEFLLDGINMLVFLIRKHDAVHRQVKAHHHLGLFVAAVCVVTSLTAVEVLFLICGPKYVAAGVDQTVLTLLALGVVYVLWLKWRGKARSTHCFTPEELDNIAAVGPALVRE